MSTELAGIRYKYSAVRHISNGSFGKVYEFKEKKSGKNVAVKCEPMTSKTLKHEFVIYRDLRSDAYPPGIPKIYEFFDDGTHYYMVMEMLGMSLQSLLTRCGGMFSIPTAVNLVKNMLKLIEYVHRRGIIHRDIKTENFMIYKNTLYIIDFGLSKYYIDRDKYQHIPYVENRSFVGTIRFCSLNVLRGREPSRRDDLESIAYCLIYMIRGILPWQGVKCTNLAYRQQ